MLRLEDSVANSTPRGVQALTKDEISNEALTKDEISDADSQDKADQVGKDSARVDRIVNKEHDDPDLRPIRWRRLAIALIIAVVIIIVFSLGTAYWGTKLAVKKSDTILSIASGPTAAPTAAQTPFSECSNRQKVLIELTLAFDSKPAEVGLSLRDSGKFGPSIWLMEEGSFQSFSQFQRENDFRICLSSGPAYQIEITDSGGNGLISQFGTTKVYGGWDLRYDREIVVSYRGDCNETRTDVMDDITNNTHLPCGEYYKCNFLMRSNGTVGDCTTDEMP